MELHTERLHLRRPAEADLEVMHAIHADPRTNTYNPAGAAVADIERSRRMLREWIEHWDQHGFGYWAVVRSADVRVLGFGGLMRREAAGEQVLNLYYRFSPEAWGSGYATEVARAARELARERFADERLVALVRTTNLPSARVAERIGLIPDDRTIDHAGVPTRVFRDPAHTARDEPNTRGERHARDEPHARDEHDEPHAQGSSRCRAANVTAADRVSTPSFP